jgi:cytochrome o ubiquinol oxidase operon protein cyoD
MSGTHDAFSHPEEEAGDVAPGVVDAAGYNVRGAVQGYIIGLALAAGLTVASFYVTGTHLIWGPGIPVALAVLAVAQIGIHLTFFLHLTSAPDNTNNVLALAFGVLIVTLVVGGSLWIMQNLNYNMTMPMPIMPMQR